MGFLPPYRKFAGVFRSPPPSRKGGLIQPPFRLVRATPLDRLPVAQTHTSGDHTRVPKHAIARGSRVDDPTSGRSGGEVVDALGPTVIVRWPDGKLSVYADTRKSQLKVSKTEQ
jgi:hypothetical protein